MKIGKIEDAGVLREGELELVNRHTRRDLDAKEVYALSVTLCDNDIDRDGERFSDAALDTLSELFVGKTGICDHSAKSENQKARIFSCHTETPEGEYTSDGRQYKKLCARAYMLRSEQNTPLIAEIDAGIKKEVSVGCSMGRRICSICGTDLSVGCVHKKGRQYKTAAGQQQCHTILCDPCDAYEWSFVAVPAQRNAGVTKAYTKKETEKMDTTQIIKQLSLGEVTLSAEEAAGLSHYIGELETLGELGKSFLAEKRAVVIRGCAEKLCGIDEDVLAAVTEKMTLSQLNEFYRMVKKTETPSVQLAVAAERNDGCNTGFMIK